MRDWTAVTGTYQKGGGGRGRGVGLLFSGWCWCACVLAGQSSIPRVGGSEEERITSKDIRHKKTAS